MSVKKRSRVSNEASRLPPTTLSFTNSKDKYHIAAAEADDFVDLCEIAASAQVIEFDSNGRVVRPSFLPSNSYDAINGLAKMPLPPEVLSSMSEIHNHVKEEVTKANMVPWAGLGEDTTRLRAFGFLGVNSLNRLDDSGVRLYAAEKVGVDAKKDEAANRSAITVLKGEWNARGFQAANGLIDALRPSGGCIQFDMLRAEELVAYQPNLHNGARHLAAHLDWPRHEGFGKVIVTVAIKGGATILLIGGTSNQDESSGGEAAQPAWRFHLNEGECYVLSGCARSRCLHAVLADDGEESVGGQRESLNLRFGLHTAEEAMEVTKFWPDEL